MASIYTDIRKTLEVTLSNVSGLPDIVYDNVNYDPDNNSSYIEARFLPTLRRPAFRGLNPQMRYQGLFSCTVFCPENKGSKTAEGYADLIIEAFEATTDISYGGTIVTIDYSERMGGFKDSPWYYIPIDIGWYIYN